MTNLETFLQTLPIIGTSLAGIFGVTALIIFIVYLLNKMANSIERARNENRDK